MKTLTDPAVQERLARFVPVMHNQLPELYCNTSVDPGVDRYPGDQVDRCPESAGGGNLRVFLCRPSGEVVFQIQGYWRPSRFLSELERGAALLAAGREEAERGHAACRARHLESEDRAELLLLRAHDEARADWGRQIRAVLDRIEDEIYTKGRIGCD